MNSSANNNSNNNNNNNDRNNVNNSSTYNSIKNDNQWFGNSSNNNLNVLLVEDSEMIRKVVSKKLINSGYNVDIAENGSIAVNKVIASMKACLNNNSN
eukprot:gene6565-9022_t